MRIRPEKLIVTSNYFPEQCFNNREDIAPILRRFRVVQDLSDLPPIPELPLGMVEAGEGVQQGVAGEVQQAEEGLQEVQKVQEAGHVQQEVQGGGEVQPTPDQSLEVEVQVGEEQVEEEQEDGLAGQQDPRCSQQ